MDLRLVHSIGQLSDKTCSSCAILLQSPCKGTSGRSWCAIRLFQPELGQCGPVGNPSHELSGSIRRSFVIYVYLMFSYLQFGFLSQVLEEGRLHASNSRLCDSLVWGCKFTESSDLVRNNPSPGQIVEKYLPWLLKNIFHFGDTTPCHLNF